MIHAPSADTCLMEGYSTKMAVQKCRDFLDGPERARWPRKKVEAELCLFLRGGASKFVFERKEFMIDNPGKPAGTPDCADDLLRCFVDALTFMKIPRYHKSVREKLERLQMNYPDEFYFPQVARQLD